VHWFDPPQSPPTQIFPKLQWIAYEPAATVQSVRNDFAFEISTPDQFIEPPTDRTKIPLQMHGYFFNSKYWHHRRELVMDQLEFNPAIQRYIDKAYGSRLSSGHGTVSVHLRVGYDGEPDAAGLNARPGGFPRLGFFQRALESFASEVTFFVFADDVVKAKGLLSKLEGSDGFKLVFVDENVATSVKMMSLCQHHVLTSSTLSFWGAYLDRKQPHGGRTILDYTFFPAHGKGMIPYSNWEVFGEEI
jgi:hypothetical protein